MAHQEQNRLILPQTEIITRELLPNLELMEEVAAIVEVKIEVPVDPITYKKNHEHHNIFGTYVHGDLVGAVACDLDPMSDTNVFITAHAVDSELPDLGAEVNDALIEKAKWYAKFLGRTALQIDTTDVTRVRDVYSDHGFSATVPNQPHKLVLSL